MLKNPIHIFLLITLIALHISCTAKKSITENETVTETLPPKLIFINSTLSKDANGKKNIQFINKIITDGTLKNNTETYLKTGAVGDLKCSQLDNVRSSEILFQNFVSRTVFTL